MPKVDSHLWSPSLQGISPAAVTLATIEHQFVPKGPSLRGGDRDAMALFIKGFNFIFYSVHSAPEHVELV